MLAWHASAIALVMVLIGGKDTTSGPAIGAILLLLAEEMLQRWTEHWLVGVGLIIVVIVIAAPQGIVPYLARLFRRRARSTCLRLVLQAGELSKSFGGLVAVDSVDVELNHAEIHAVIGPNGAGKTTFLSTLAGDCRPQPGGSVSNSRTSPTPAVPHAHGSASAAPISAAP